MEWNLRIWDEIQSFWGKVRCIYNKYLYIFYFCSIMSGWKWKWNGVKYLLVGSPGVQFLFDLEIGWTASLSSCSRLVWRLSNLLSLGKGVVGMWEWVGGGMAAVEMRAWLTGPTRPGGRLWVTLPSKDEMGPVPTMVAVRICGEYLMTQFCRRLKKKDWSYMTSMQSCC